MTLCVQIDPSDASLFALSDEYRVRVSGLAGDEESMLVSANDKSTNDVFECTRSTRHESTRHRSCLVPTGACLPATR